MKSQKGMSHLMLILSIIIIIIIIVGVTYLIRNLVEEEGMKNYQTDMLLIQGKVKILSQESIIEKNEGILKGKKVSENLEDEQIKLLIEKNVISQEEGSFSKYYILENSNLEEMGIENVVLKEGFYIVNYDTDEIIYSKGIEIEDNTYYKLSELKHISNQKENLTENIEINVEENQVVE